MSSTATGPALSARAAETAMAPNIPPGATMRSYTRWSGIQAGSEGNISVSNATSPRGDSWRVPSSAWPASRRRRPEVCTQ